MQYAESGLLALIDTGAAVSLMRHDVFLKLNNINTSLTLEAPPHGLQSVTGNKLVVTGITHILFSNVDTSLRFFVVPDLPHEVILGSDILNNGQAELDLELGILTWYRRLFHITYEKIQTSAKTFTTRPCYVHTELDHVLGKFSDVFACSEDKMPISKSPSFESKDKWGSNIASPLQSPSGKEKGT